MHVLQSTINRVKFTATYQDVCDEDSVRSLNTQKVEAAGLNVESTGKKSLLCKTHYKEWKKETKDDRELERARYDKF